ncbi:MAG TPA: STAS domain-containing protein [Mycobacteriales bacterium]|nr:STAS domain-containing protein [Mycobacteriales bacterium]
MTAGYDALPFRVSVTRSGTRAVVRLVGELDVATAPELEAAIEDLLGADRPELVLVEAGELAFADVVGLGILLEAAARLAPQGRLRIRDAGRQLVRILTLLDHADLIEER